MDTSICIPTSPQNNEACCPSHTLNLLFSSMPFLAGLLRPRHHLDSCTSPFPKSHEPLKSCGFYLVSICHICPSLLCPLIRAQSYQVPHVLLKQFASGSPHFHSCLIQNGSHTAHAMILEYKPDLSLCCGAQGSDLYLASGSDISLILIIMDFSQKCNLTVWFIILYIY